MLSIRTNVGSINAQRNLFSSSSEISKSIEKLSSGFRINRAADDAAGLAVSEKLTTQVRGLNQAARNAMDGMSMIQTAESAMDELQSMLQRMRELSVQASNETLGASERDNLWQEIDQLEDEMQAIASRTSFNGQKLLTGSMRTSLDATNEVKVGLELATGNDSLVTAVDVSNAATNAAAVRKFKFTNSGTSLTLTDQTDTSRNQTLTLVDGDFTSGATKTLDFSQLGIKITIQVSTQGASAAANIATDLAAGDEIIVAAGSGSAQIQNGANENETLSLSFVDLRIDDVSTGAIDALDTKIEAMKAGSNARTATDFGNLITLVDNTINYVTTQRATLGAQQNRLEHSVAYVKAASENLAASNSRIRDVDVAEESAKLVRTQVLMQAATSVLAQANQMPQLALKLLG